MLLGSEARYAIWILNWSRPKTSRQEQSIQTDSSSDGSGLEKICERYRHCYAELVYDVLEHFGYPNQALSHELMPLTPDMKLAGPAFTVKSMTTTEKDEALRYRRLEMIKQMRRPCVEVRERATPYPVAIYGELSWASAAAHGAVGALARLPQFIQRWNFLGAG